MLVFLIFFILPSSKNKPHLNLLLLLVTLVILMGVEFNINKGWSLTMVRASLVNPNLLNGIMLIHPVTLYIFYSLYFLKLSVLFGLLLILKKTQHKNQSKQNPLIYSTAILITTILGCWWAEQELAWGG